MFFRVIVCSVMSCSAIATSLQAEDEKYSCMPVYDMTSMIRFHI